MRNLKAILLAIPILASCSTTLNYDLLSQRTEQVLARFPELKSNSKALTELVFREEGLTFERATRYNAFFDYEAVQVFHQSEISPKQANTWADFCNSRNIVIRPSTIIKFEQDKLDTLEVGKHLDRYSSYRSF